MMIEWRERLQDTIWLAWGMENGVYAKDADRL